MNTATVSESQNSSADTDLYYVRGVPAQISDSDLSAYFSRLAQIQNVVVHRPKNPAKKGYAFVSTHKTCQLLSITGAKFELLGFEMSIEPASDPSRKIVTPEERSSKKVFIGEIPQAMTIDEVLAAVAAHGQVEKLTRFKVKSDRTKYCYAIMQRLEDATSMTNMKRLKVTDPSNQFADIVLSLGSFIPKSKQPLQFLESKYIHGEYHQKTVDSSRLPFNESLGSHTEKIHYSKSNLEDSECNKLEMPENNPPVNPDSQRKGFLESKVHQVKPANLPLGRLEVSKAGDSKIENKELKADVQVLLRKNLLLTLDHRHETANIRFNILLD